MREFRFGIIFFANTQKYFSTITISEIHQHAGCYSKHICNRFLKLKLVRLKYVLAYARGSFSHIAASPNDSTMANNTLSVPDNVDTSNRSGIPAPAEVRWGLKLLWLSLALGVVQFLLFLPVAVSTLPADSVGRGAAVFGFAFQIAAYMLGAYVNISIARQKNWARIVKLLLAVASLVPQVMFSPSLAGFEYVRVGISPALDVAALYLLFISPGRRWFRQASIAT